MEPDEETRITCFQTASKFRAIAGAFNRQRGLSAGRVLWYFGVVSVLSCLFKAPDAVIRMLPVNVSFCQKIKQSFKNNNLPYGKRKLRIVNPKCPQIMKKQKQHLFIYLFIEVYNSRSRFWWTPSNGLSFTQLFGLPCTRPITGEPSPALFLLPVLLDQDGLPL